MQHLTTVKDLRTFVRESRAKGKTVSFVPTMGALHDGHLALVRAGMDCADICIPYIFVNPAQFAPHEDFDSYPRTVEADLDKLGVAGVQAVYLPKGKEDVYPEGFATTVSVSGVSEPLEGAFRPHFFAGVATVVTKMLLRSLPDIALFGEKDWQQLQVIKRLTADLDIPVEIRGVPIVRDENGLALSSRNAYLDEEQYRTALSLNRTLFAMADKVRSGQDQSEIESWGAAQLTDAGFEKVDYCTIRNASTLQKTNDNSDDTLRILAAAWVGKARLIDNVAA